MCDSSFHLNIKGHFRVMNWLNFSTVVSRRLGRPKVRGEIRDRLVEQSDCDSNICHLPSYWFGHLYFWSIVYIGMVCNTPKIITEECQTEITGPHITESNIIIKKSEILKRVTKLPTYETG